MLGCRHRARQSNGFAPNRDAQPFHRADIQRRATFARSVTVCSAVGCRSCQTLGIVAKVLPITEPQIIRRLLTQQAEEFFGGARFLGKHKFEAGDAGYFLNLLAIELYFKLIYLAETESLVFGHDVCEIYDLLPIGSRGRLFERFDASMLPHLEHATFREWLKYLGNLFVHIRYPFEEFREMSLEQYEERMRQFEGFGPISATADDLRRLRVQLYAECSCDL